MPKFRPKFYSRPALDNSLYGNARLPLHETDRIQVITTLW